MRDIGLSNLAQRAVDSEPSFPLRSFLTSLFVHKWIFLVCAIVPAILTLLTTALTPITWEAKAQILIRYSESESPFLKDLIPDDRASLSGEASSEILRGLPVIEDTVRRYDIHKEDLYRSTPKVISGRISDWLGSIVPSNNSTGDAQADANAQVLATAKTFQDSLLEGDGATPSSKVSPVEILAKSSNLPAALKGDELITVSVKAFNRQKVAAMTNGLAASFINRIYAISEQDARQSHDYLTALVKKSSSDVGDLEQHPSKNAPMSNANAAGVAAPESPATARLAAELADSEGQYDRLRAIFKPNAPQVRRAAASLGRLRGLYTGQRQLEAAQQVLDLEKTRRFEALNTENLYKNHLIPISIIEPATTPAASASALIGMQVRRLLTSAVTGLLVGTILGLGLVTTLSLLDRRLFTEADAELALGLPVYGQIPLLARDNSGILPAPTDIFAGCDTSIARMLARIDAAGIDAHGHVVAIVSDRDEDGKSLVALLVATAVASGGSRVLLIDGDPVRASLSHYFGMTAAPGVIPAISSASGVVGRPVATGISNLDFVPAGTLSSGPSSGFYMRRLRPWLDAMRVGYDLVILDTPSVTTGGGLVHATAADKVLLVVRSGVSRRSDVDGLMRQLREVGVMPQGAVINFTRKILPDFIDRHV